MAKRKWVRCVCLLTMLNSLAQVSAQSPGWRDGAFCWAQAGAGQPEEETS